MTKPTTRQSPKPADTPRQGTPTTKSAPSPFDHRSGLCRLTQAELDWVIDMRRAGTSLADLSWHLRDIGVTYSPSALGRLFKRIRAGKPVRTTPNKAELPKPRGGGQDGNDRN